MALLNHSGNPVSVQLIACRAKIPAAYLAKLLQRLVKAGLAVSQRGVHGGFSLARDPGSITLADIVNAVEPLQRITVCPLGITGHIALCPLHRRLDAALAVIEQALQETTLLDLCQESGSRLPLCGDSSGIVDLGLLTPNNVAET